MSKKLTPLQKAGALVPMAILVGAWGIAVGNSGLATALGGTSASIPEVPALALEQPATVQRTVAGVDAQAGVPGAISTLSTNGIPSAALYAYHHAETLLASADAGCRLPWNLVAAIGRVESNHGRIDGNALSADGVASPGIYGETTKKVADTDGGKYDKDAKADRPVGPMGLMPTILKDTLLDADNDGSVNPQDIDDEATTSGVFLCSGEGDLSTEPGARAAVQRYNSNASYVDLVMKVSASYANGLYSQTPDGYSTSTILTSQAYDQTLSSDERKEARKKQRQSDAAAKAAEEAAKNGGTSGSGPTGGGPTGGDNNDNDTPGGGGGGGGGGESKPDPVGDAVKETTKQVEETVKKVEETVKEVEDTVKDVTDTVDSVVQSVTGG
jgi:hypothetical protein